MRWQAVKRPHCHRYRRYHARATCCASIFTSTGCRCIPVIDTAGLRDASDEVERIGIERAAGKLNRPIACCLWLDGAPRRTPLTPADIWPDFIARLPKNLPITVVRNKADITGETLGISEVKRSLTGSPRHYRRRRRRVRRNHLKQSMGF